MKYYFSFLIIFILFINSCKSQVNNEANILEGLIRSIQPIGTIVLTDKIPKSILDRIKLELHEKTITGLPVPETNSIKLTEEEQSYLFKSIDSFQNFVWEKSLINNSEIIEYESLWNYLEKEQIKFYEKLNKLKLPGDSVEYNKMMNSELPHVFTFTPPIFLRNNEISFIFIQDLCGGNCGSQSYMFLKKDTADNWKKWVMVNKIHF